MNTPLQSLAWRYATKKFDTTKTISHEDMQTLLECLRLSPSSYGLQPWKFVLVEKAETRTALKEHSWNQSQITDASALIVLCARTDVNEAYVQKYVHFIAETQGIQPEALEGFKQMMLGAMSHLAPEQLLNWNKHQVYIALGVLLASAASMGIDACPMEGFDAKKYDALLKLPNEGLTTTVVCALGYRAADDLASEKTKIRFPAAEVMLLR